MNNYSEILPTDRLKEIFNTPDEKSAVKVMCRQVLLSLNLSNPPIPLKPVCQKFNLKVNYTDSIRQEDSFLQLAPSGFQMEISKLRSWRRNRFTIAHELTHLMLFKVLGSPLNSFARKQHDLIEQLCDIGASELLINDEELDKRLRLYGLNTEGLKTLYDCFMVSYDTLFTRLSDMFTCNIVIWKNYARHRKEEQEYRIYRHFPIYKDSIKSIWLPNGCTVKHIGPVHFNEILSTRKTIALDNFQVMMNGKTTECKVIIFPFPHSRNLNDTLPIFELLTIKDEAVYDNCVIMLLFSDRKKFEKVTTSYLKD